MTYDCINAYEDIFEAAEKYLPLPRSLDTDDAGDVAQTICEAMAISAQQRQELRAALAALVALRDRPHGFPDNNWYESAFDAARALLAKVQP